MHRSRSFCPRQRLCHIVLFLAPKSSPRRLQSAFGPRMRTSRTLDISSHAGDSDSVVEETAAEHDREGHHLGSSAISCPMRSMTPDRPDTTNARPPRLPCKTSSRVAPADYRDGTLVCNGGVEGTRSPSIARREGEPERRQGDSDPLETGGLPVSSIYVIA